MAELRRHSDVPDPPDESSGNGRSGSSDQVVRPGQDRGADPDGRPGRDGGPDAGPGGRGDRPSRQPPSPREDRPRSVPPPSPSELKRARAESRARQAPPDPSRSRMSGAPRTPSSAPPPPSRYAPRASRTDSRSVPPSPERPGRSDQRGRHAGRDVSGQGGQDGRDAPSSGRRFATTEETGRALPDDLRTWSPGVPEHVEAMRALGYTDAPARSDEPAPAHGDLAEDEPRSGELQQQAAELEDVRAATKADFDDARAAVKTEFDAAVADLKETITRPEDARAAERPEPDKAVEAVKAEAAKAIEAVKTEAAKEIADLKAEHARKIADLDAAHAQETAELKGKVAELNGRIAELEDKNLADKAERAEEMATFKENVVDEVLAKLKQDYDIVPKAGRPDIDTGPKGPDEAGEGRDTPTADGGRVDNPRFSGAAFDDQAEKPERPRKSVAIKSALYGSAATSTGLGIVSALMHSDTGVAVGISGIVLSFGGTTFDFARDLLKERKGKNAD